MPTEKKNFEIKYNNGAVKDPCAVCGWPSNPNIPLAIFATGTRRPICDCCAEKYAPEMHEALHLFYVNGGVEKFLDRVGRDFQKRRSAHESRMSFGKSMERGRKGGARR